ncbi:carboxypeptidase-like regulatory domain-containing protein [Edaphobacter aggregans]|uniref:carboxypeptidase-like regulatory domain-containing protein n=1 Tax=Edaphobacter aggregans TaxID=570835 RepID=UPI00054E8282|nr:carboxypeptidase-like regulatory domain-containing protein [Edaphobacter aggregans]
MRATLALWMLVLAGACPEQTVPTTPAPEPNGIVTGRVFCGDTGRPARFASVSLMPVTDPAKTKLDKAGLNAGPSKPAAPTTSITTAVDTTLDGGYTLTHVAPGTYYVIVRKDGYINPVTIFTKKQLDEPTDQIRNLIEQALPKVNVEQDSTAHADVQLQRGAAVSGTISYDDETPASNVNVTLLHKDESGKWVPLSGPGAGPRRTGSTTNDRGYFRIASLLPDVYLLRADLSLENERTAVTGDAAGHKNEMVMRNIKFFLSFYGDGTPHIDQATSFTLRGDDERTGQNMTLPISKLRNLTGRVAAGPSGHFVNAANLELIYGPDKKSLAHSNIDREDGLFHFEFVPEGDYTLRVTNARDVTWEPDAPQPGMMPPPPGFPAREKERVLETYGNVDMPLILRGDMTGITATVPAKQSSSPAASN